ncbi:MAG: hypothetical protein U0746_09755 [Gemmataceae bacterium]
MPVSLEAMGIDWLSVRERLERIEQIWTLLVLFCFALPVQAEDKDATIRFLGGEKKTPIEGLKVTIRKYTGDWSVDQTKTLTDGKTDQKGNVRFPLADGWYYVEIASDKELPYLDRPVGFKSPPNLYSRMVRVGNERTFVFNLANACKLTLRAVDVDTGKGLPGAVFVTENAVAEDWAGPIHGDNLGSKRIVDHRDKIDDTLKTDKDGNFTRLIGPRHGYTYFVWTAPPGYVIAGKQPEIVLESPVGTEKVEHVFKFKKKN